jgi:hypothetical protein
MHKLTGLQLELASMTDLSASRLNDLAIAELSLIAIIGLLVVLAGLIAWRQWHRQRVKTA